MTDSSMDDSVNTEAVNDEPSTVPEVAPEQSGATPAGGGEGAQAPADVVDGEVLDAEAVPDTDDAHGEDDAASDDAAPKEDDAAGDGAHDGAAQADPAGTLHPDAVLAAERLADLQRLQAEYVNYKRRVDRDRSVVQERSVHDVLRALFPVLDDLQAARDHGDLSDGPFAAIADKLESTLARYGLVRYGAKGEEFDPQMHEALMHAPWPTDDPDLPADGDATIVVTVLQPGYRAGDHVLRPARVAVADPE